MSTLKHQIAQAPKYTLYIEGVGYLADKQKLSGCNVTKEKSEACVFAHGFDNPQIKLGIWNTYAKRLFNKEFSIVNL